MPRRHKNARNRAQPKPLKPFYRVVITEWPKKERDDFRPGRVVVVAEYQRRRNGGLPYDDQGAV